MDMYKLKGLTQAACGLVLILSVSTANAMDVIISNLADGDGVSNLFDVSGTSASGSLITIGLNDFRADGTNALQQSAVDTLSMTLTAPTGFVITSISYSESGAGKTESGVAVATGSLVADGIPVNFLQQLYAPNTGGAPGDPIIGWSIDVIDLAIANKESIDLNITNSLFAFSFGGAAEIEKTEATLTVGLSAIPIPPAIWMMGAAITALVTVGRRGGQAS